MAFPDSQGIVKTILSAIDKKLDRYKLYVTNAIRDYRIGSDQLKRGAIVGSKIAANAIYAIHIVARSITATKIALEAIEAEHLTISAKESVTTSNRNLLRDSVGLVESSTYLIAEYEATELLPNMNYTIVVEGYANEGQQILVKFNDGAYGSISAPFNDDGIAVIRTGTPSSLTNQKIRLYNYPSISATQAEIYWACMYKGFITSPPHDYTPTIEEINARLDENQTAIGELISTVSSKTTIFYQNDAPTTDNIGDLWYDTDAYPVQIYRWTGSSWADCTSVALSAALAAAATAQATADGKIVTFAQAASPTGASTGDLWMDTDDNNKMYRWSGSSWVSVQDGNISALSTAISNLTSSMNAKTTIFYQTSAPTATATGDVWYDTDATPTVKIYRWSGSAWIDITTAALASALSAAADAKSTADGKIVTFAQTSAPTATAVGDLWVDTDDNNKLYRWNGSAWATARDTALDGRVATIETNYDGLTGTMTTIARQTAYTGSLPPTTPTDYASWINTGVTPPEQLRWTGNSANTARSYAASITAGSVRIPDPSDNHALNVTIKTIATQAAGTISPATPRAISGKSLIVRRCGKNIFNPADVQTGTIDPSTGANIVDASYSRTSYIRINPSTAYTISYTGSYTSATVRFYWYDYNYTFISVSNAATYTGPNSFTSPSNAAFVRIRVFGTFKTDTQLEVGSTATAYVAYSGTDHILNTDDTAYGLTGAEDEGGNDGHVIHKTILATLDSTATIASAGLSAGITGKFRFWLTAGYTLAAAVATNNTVGKIISSHFPSLTANQTYLGNVGVAIDTNGRYEITVDLTTIGAIDADSEATKIAKVKTWLDAQKTALTPVQVLYQRAVNATATLAPVQINGTDGINTVSSDGISLTMNYVGSGWELISGKANSLYASGEMKFDANGMEITQTTVDGKLVSVKHITNTEKSGYFRTSDGKMLGGLKVIKVSGGDKVINVTSGLIDPESDGNAYVDVATTTVVGGSRTALRLMGVSYNGGTTPPYEELGAEESPPQTGNVEGLSFGFNTGWAWADGSYIDDVNAFIYSPGMLDIFTDGELFLSGGGGVTIDGCFMEYGGLDSRGNDILTADFSLRPLVTNDQFIGSSDFRWRTIFSQDALNTGSDERIKRDITPLSNAPNFILSLNPFAYRYTFDEDNAPMRMGFGARATDEALNASGMSGYALVNRENPDEYAMGYTELIAPIVSTVQYQQNLIEAQNQKIQSLEDRIARLEQLLLPQSE